MAVYVFSLPFIGPLHIVCGLVPRKGGGGHSEAISPSFNYSPQIYGSLNESNRPNYGQNQISKHSQTSMVPLSLI